jgi:hypothetical protein
VLVNPAIVYPCNRIEKERKNKKKHFYIFSSTEEKKEKRDN